MRRLALLVAVCLLTASTAAAAIKGYAMNADGAPIAGARVETFALESIATMRARLMSATPDPKALATSVTDANGKFSIESPKDPVVMLRITASGYAPLSARVERDDDAGAMILSPAETKTGRITANGKPVAGAKVLWAGSSQMIATTDAEGRYQMPDPSKWAYTMLVLHPDFAPLYEANGPMGPRRGGRRGGAVAATALNETMDASLEAGAPLTGTVVGEDGKTPIAGATVAVDGLPLATTGDDGKFTIAHGPTKWELLVAQNGTLAGTRARTAAGGIVVKLAKAASVTGTIRDAKNQPVAGAEVTLGVPTRAERAQIWSTVTDAKGNYALTGITPGSYAINATRPGYAIPSVTLALTANEHATKSLVATQLARIAGTVVDEQKRPVAAARITPQQLSRGNGDFAFMMMMGGARGTPPAASAPDGTFVVRAEGDTDLEVEAAKKGYPAARSTKFRVSAGERKSGLVLTIPSGVVVTGHVIDKNGKPVPGATVAAMPSTGGGGGFARRMVINTMRGRDDEQIKTAADGTFSTRVKEGTYDFAFKADGFAVKALRAVQIGASTKPLEVTLEPGVEVAGRVTRARVGVEGVRINLLGESNSTDTTAADGSFHVSDLSPGQYMLMATKDDEFIQQIRPVTAPASDANIDLPAGGRITGRVVDKTTHNPVTAFDAGLATPRSGGGMMVMLPPVTKHFTNDDGTFVLENVPPGQTQVVVNAPGYTTARVPNVNVEDGKTVADLDVELDHGVRAVGHVTGPDGSPLSGVAVSLDGGGGRMMNIAARMNQTVTDANGDFTMDALESGDKTFVFTRSGFLTTQRSATLSGSETRVDAQMSQGLRVSGTVTNEAGVPVGDAFVSARSAANSGFGQPSTRTDDSGSFSFEGLAPGRYTFSAGKQGLADGQVVDFDISTGAPVRIVMKSGGVIYGQVTGLTADELQRATVIATSANGNASAPVDASGAFRIEGAPVGTVRVMANAAGGLAGGKTSPVHSVQVETGSQVQVNIAFKSDTVVSGRVTRNGQVVQGAMVNFSPKEATAQTRATATTDSNGQYQVSGLDDASYTVTVVDLQRSAPYTASYEVHGSGTFDVDMKTAALRGHVTDSDGNAVSDAMVEVRDKESTGAGMRMSRMVQTDAGGTFLIDNVPSGTYTVTAEKEGYGTRAVDTVVNDSGGNVDIALAKNPGVTLRVVDARDGRAINAQVHVTNARGEVVYDSPFFGGGGSGETIKLPLEAGSYTAEISAMGYASHTATIISPSTPTIGLTPGGTILVQSKGSTLRRARLIGPDGREYTRGRGTAIFVIDPSPGVTTLNNVAPGTYTLQILGDANNVTASAPVTVMEGQQAAVSI